ncbi:glycoside hydrolase family 65 protein [Raineyella fluvialis]|uniref:Glycoside hydrolase family 65 protein n=1 Tax=Raineyella fluvialis TaxID=2662261 RepID=A0A5Q2FHZ3_9ACTN|nr:glycosyl hydrolase family 65 protein [Raineyella fluvialis]QGF23976.1 glycoside hydrolase family 65 protein [Raineyella fluvialis]
MRAPQDSHIPPDPLDPMDRTRFPVDEWRLVETSPELADLGRTETLFAVANGYLGMRGNPEEGRESAAHGTFINGFHETWTIRHAEEAYGFARVGQTIINAPDTKVLKLYVDDEPITVPDADLDEYERSLDFRDGILRRHLVWRTPAGKRVRIDTTRMVSMSARHLAVMTMDVTLLDADAPVVISSQILNRQDGEDEYHVRSAAQGLDPRRAEGPARRVLVPQMNWTKGLRAMLGYRATDSGMTLTVGIDHAIETENVWQSQVMSDEDVAKVIFRIWAGRGKPIRLVKYAAYHTSRSVPVRELIDRVSRTLDRAVETGVEEYRAAQRSWYEDFWEHADVVVGTEPGVQQAVRWNLFALAQASALSQTHGIPAKGVTGAGYSGHYFWDAEVYVLPFLTYTMPQVARSALRFRYLMLDAARRRAGEMATRGALFPWRTINGEEASAFYAAGTAQYHIDADIAYALSRYVEATGDMDFLLREGIDILVETARMWADLGFWTENVSPAFHIHAVTGPDEYTTVVNDNLFTNVMARHNLRLAAENVARLAADWPEAYERMVRRLDLHEDEVEEWQRCAEHMAIPYDEHIGVHPQDAHFLDREVWDLDATPPDRFPLMLHYHPLVLYRFQVLKQADVVLAMLLQGDQFSREQKRADFEYYDPITTGDSTLSSVVQSIIAAEVGYQELALRYFYGGLFVDLVDRHGNTSDGVHVASLGGVWMALTAGFAGMRDHHGALAFDPRLPTRWESISFRLRRRGGAIRVELTRDALTVTLLEGTSESFSVRGEDYEVRDDAPCVRVPLADQGPQVPGPVPPQTVIGVRRDGSRITAGVPGTFPGSLRSTE